jgi:glycosyltransferase involved in cell wall biosynthesis
MRILQIHKYFSYQNGGGSVTAFFQTKKLLEKKGNQVIIFSMQDKSNVESIYSKYFIKHFDINKANNFFQKISWAFKSIFNFEAQRKLEELIKKEKPEVAHIHNIYHYLTPSILHTLKKHKIPMVFKLSDYKAICPNYKLFNQGKICEKCRGGKYYNCFLNRCLKNSWSISFVAMLEAYLHRWLKSYSKIDFFLAPSEFMKKKCVEFGIPARKIKILRNVVNVEEFSLADEDYSEDNYVLFYGRISEEKGIEDLIRAIKILKESGELEKNRLKIVGKGPLENHLKKVVAELNLKKEVLFEGFKSGLELKKIIKKAKLIVLPSVWYDNSPLVISEAQLLKKPVVISDKGGSKEMIIDKKTGLVFEGGRIDDLAEKLKEILKMSISERNKMGELGRENIIKINNDENYYQNLMKIYKEVINK